MSKYPTIPPPELVKQWVSLACEYEGNETWIDLATQAARWGWQQRDASVADELQKARDEELEACCEYLTRCAAWEPEDVKEFCGNRRPEPPSLAEQALALINHDPENQPFLSEEGIATIRRALERLQELEQRND